MSDEVNVYEVHTLEQDAAGEWVPVTTQTVKSLVSDPNHRFEISAVTPSGITVTATFPKGKRVEFTPQAAQIVYDNLRSLAVILEALTQP